MDPSLSSVLQMERFLTNGIQRLVCYERKLGHRANFKRRRMTDKASFSQGILFIPPTPPPVTQPGISLGKSADVYLLTISALSDPLSVELYLSHSAWLDMGIGCCLW